MAKTRAERIAAIDEEIRQRENQKKKLIQEQKKAERDARTKRLCQRMGLFEKLLPDTITLTDEQFRAFLEKTILTESASKLLSALSAQSAADDAQQTARMAAKPVPDPADDADADGQGEGAGNGEGESDAPD